MNKIRLTFVQLASLAFVAAMLSFAFQSCKDDKDKQPDPPKKEDPKQDDDPKDNGKDYIKMADFGSFVLEFRNPEMGSMTIIAGDTSLRWSGNKPSTAVGDTILTIIHPSTDMELNPVPRIAGSHNVVQGAFDEGEVGITMRLGTVDGRPFIYLTGGDYTLSRKDGKWVSMLKNGTGTWTNSIGDKVNYTGIEFRATWPE